MKISYILSSIFVLTILSALYLNSSWKMYFLPKPTGPYPVAIADVITKAGKDGTFFRLFYPTNDCTPDSTTSPAWMPAREYSNGITRFIKFSWFGGIVHHFTKSYFLPVKRNGSLVLPPETSKLPIIVFSHGLGGNRALQSFTCYELASYGVIVAAIEHKDHSASATYTLDKIESDTSEGTYTQNWLEYTHPPKDSEELFKFRNSQINQRAHECSDLLSRLVDLDEGNLSNILEGNDLTMFRNRLDFDKCGIYGHSFGGGTAIKAMGLDTRFKAGVLLDAWMYPIEKEFYSKPLSQPMLFINNEAFMWKENLATCRKLDADVFNQEVAREMITLKGAVHWSQTDLTFILPHYWLLSKVFKAAGETDPILVNKITGIAIRKFFGENLDIEPFKTEKNVTDEYSGLVMTGSNIELDEDRLNQSKQKLTANL